MDLNKRNMKWKSKTILNWNETVNLYTVIESLLFEVLLNIDKSSTIFSCSSTKLNICGRAKPQGLEKKFHCKLKQTESSSTS